jgi:hypothetical protein
VTIFRNEILRLQCPTHNAVLLWYELICTFKFEHSC